MNQDTGDIVQNIMCAAMNACLEEEYKVEKMEYIKKQSMIKISPRNIWHGDVVIKIFSLEKEIVILPQKRTKNGLGRKFAQKLKANCNYPIQPNYMVEVN